MFDETILKAIEQGSDLEAAIEEAAQPMRDLLRRALRPDSFIPFRISMTGGWTHEVRHPREMEVRDSVAELRVPDPDQPGQWHERAILALIHVVSVQFFPPDAPTVLKPPRKGNDS